MNNPYKTILISFLLIIATNSVVAQSQKISFTLPPEKIALFGEGVVSTFVNERDFALSPDGNELYFTVSTPRSLIQTIVFCKKIKQDTWSQPEVVSFAGTFSDLEPAFSKDGKTLYFASNRPLSGDKAKDFDIWRVRRTDGGWGIPENIGSPVNTKSDEFYPSISNSGNLYFTAMYPDGVGKEDIYVSAPKDNSFLSPVPLDTAVNSKLYEFNAFISPDEDFILFTSYGRKDDAGKGDLYISLKDKNGKWKKAVNVVDVNSPYLDYCPYVSPDKKILFLTSERHQPTQAASGTNHSYKGIAATWMNPLNGNGNIYWIDFQKILQRIRGLD
jgi:Tol biopolymer transport system component